jgi:subtilisin-like proprotein convertase family protein/Ca2+-binding RTX toxin-like protein
MKFTEQDILQAKALLREKGPTAVYDFLASIGSKYAILANGVAKEDTLAGISAVSYMRERYFEDHGVEMPDILLERIKFRMAEEAIFVWKDNIDNPNFDISLRQAEKFHGDIFVDIGLKENYWTLHDVLAVLPSEKHESYWASVLDLAGSTAGELWVAAKTHSDMRVYGALPGNSDRAWKWMSRLESPRVAAALSGSLLEPAGTYAKNAVDYFMDAPGAQDSLEVAIKSDPLPKTLTGDENAPIEAVRNGFVVQEPTHKILLKDEALDRTDFLSTQIASLATGGIRPGEVQIDPNVRPNEYLQQSFIDKGDACTPTERLQNSLILNNLGAQTTSNVYVDPLLLDLSGNGVQMTSITEGTVFDIDNSGTVKRTGWAGPGTGLLVLGDEGGLVRHGGQLVSEYLGGVQGKDGLAGEARFTDAFAALASLDSNSDGVINTADAQWQQLKVWADDNRNGISEPGELKSLDDWAISQIDLGAERVDQAHGTGNTLRSRGAFTIAGQVREALAVNFLSDAVSHVVQAGEAGQFIKSQAADVTRSSFVSANDSGTVLDAQALGVQTLQGGLGSDTLKAAPSGSWLVGGGGRNRYEGGQGDDVFVISASDDTSQIDGGGGRDAAIVVGDQAVSLNLAKAGLLMAQGGRGHDVLVSGGNRGVFIKGGAAGSTIFGGGGNDVLVGGQGRNTIVGGTGKSVIYAGPKADLIFASVQGSIIYAGAGEARITGRDADDVIEAGKGNAVIDGGGGVNLVTLHGDHGEYRIIPTETGYRIEDTVAGRDGTLSLTRIQKLNFANISAVSLTGPNAMPVADVIRTDATGAPLIRQGGARVIAASTLLANDHSLASQGPLRIREVSDAMGGSVALNEQGDVVFTPAAGHGAMGFKYALEDAAGNPAMRVVSLKTGEVAPMRGEVHLLTEQTPVDPLAARQWYLADIGVLPIWEQYSGKGVRVGIFEPGGEFSVGPETFDIHHPDLAPNVDAGWLAAQRKAGTLPGQFSNHATQVAGVLAAAKDGQGAVGVAHGASIGGHYLANRGDDLTGLTNTSHYDVANNSWSFTKPFGLTNLTEGRITSETALMLNAQYAARNGRGGLGTVMITAGGNQRAEGGSAQSSLTNNHRYGIQVGAINAQGDLSTLQIGAAPFSNPGASLLVSAPGSNVLSTSRKVDTERGSVFGSDYSAAQGTSFAAPIVSGIAALMLEANPSLGYRDVQRILAMSATYVADPNTQWAYNGAKHWNGGGMHKSDDYGFGKVDARAAVRLAESWSANSTLENEHHVGAARTPINLAVPPGETTRSAHELPAGVKVEHVEVNLYSEVGQLGDLQLRLTSPSGTQSLLLDRVGKKRSGEGAGEADRGSERSGAFNYSFMSTQHWGERSQGTWTLEAINADGGKPLTLNSWGLRAYGEATSADDHYVYTDAFATLAGEPGRALLDDAAMGTAGGFNTLNAAAMSGDVTVDLQSGNATLAGKPLNIVAPGHFGHVITGDGNDRLVASGVGSVLEGGRGSNTLIGGAGKDLYVVRQRRGGEDTIHGFEAAKGELINFSGTGVGSFENLTLTQEGPHTHVALPDGQRLVIADTALATVSADHVRFDRQLTLPEGYFDSIGTVAPALPALAPGEIVLKGGAKGVGLTFGAEGAAAKLLGTVYERNDAGPATFVVARQEGVTKLSNALRGFNPGTDVIDVAQLGVSRWSELLIEKQERVVINGIALANGTSIKTRPDAQGRFIDVVYIDGLDPNRLGEQHLRFAPAGSTPYLPDPTSNSPEPLLAATLPPPANLLQAMASFAPEAAGSNSASFEPRQFHHDTLLTQVA